MRLFLVKEDDRLVWVAALAHETMYAYVANTGKFHDHNALRNDYYIDRYLSYEEIGPSEARRLIADGLGTLDESDDEEPLREWRADPNPLEPADVLSMAAGYRG
ncbi:hypothetical protein HPO96_23905 [Kribbella sandramycini]|uniref:Uncharacterized protein n=1 Tax=Kribbella sandramycini TaxID=60450 RepID=A0A7Y4P2P0_9ACTN|nr:hypothetical protein [Kribbella sandramycini]MBB6571302.1 hypothetical protein [Kribbella sandramycini]NOL43294.1 hypothetical protein [Kribbella sandramycini]